MMKITDEEFDNRLAEAYWIAWELLSPIDPGGK